jgi:hypothetical protein
MDPRFRRDDSFAKILVFFVRFVFFVVKNAKQLSMIETEFKSKGKITQDVLLSGFDLGLVF